MKNTAWPAQRLSTRREVRTQAVALGLGSIAQLGLTYMVTVEYYIIRLKISLSVYVNYIRNLRNLYSSGISKCLNGYPYYDTSFKPR